jgi:branched-chain amino acid transport system permease protein
MGELAPFLVSGLGVGAVYALSGVGLVVLYRSAGVLNFAFGAIGALGAFVAWSMLQSGWPQSLAWLACVLTSALLSLAYGRLLAPRLAIHNPTIRSVSTLGFALVALGFMDWYWGEQPRRLVLPTDSGAMEFSMGETVVRLSYTRVLGLALAVAMMVGISVLLVRTRLGLRMRALANDRELSALLGVQVLQVDTAAWALSGICGGVCGLLLANMVRLQASLLTFLVIPAFAGAIIGRLQSLPVTMMAGLAIGLLEALAIAVPGFAEYRSATPFVIALVMIAFSRPTARLA